jgi:hypothetical protein
VQFNEYLRENVLRGVLLAVHPPSVEIHVAVDSLPGLADWSSTDMLNFAISLYYIRDRDPVQQSDIE